MEEEDFDAAELNEQKIDERDIAQVYEFDDNEGDRYPSDDEDDMASSSNMSAVAEEEIVDDSATSLQAHAQDCFCIAMAGNRWLASGGEDDVAFLFDQRSSESDPVLKIEHGDSVTHAMFNSSESLLATGDMGGKIVVTHLASLETRAELTDCNDLEWLSWHNTSDILFAGDKDGMIWMWLIGPKGVVQSKVYPGSGTPCSVGFLLPDGKRILAGYEDGTVRLWQLREQTSTQLNFHAPITAIQHHLTQPVAIIGTQKGYVYVINTAQEDSLRRVSMIPPLNDTKVIEEDDVDQCVESLSFAPSHPWFAVGRNDGSICVYETNSASPRTIFRCPAAQAISRTVWTNDGLTPLLCVGSIDGLIRIFDARDGSLFKQIGNGGDEVLDLLVVETCPLRLMSASSGGVIRVFDVSRL